MNGSTASPPETIRWTDGGAALRILDQTELPERRVKRDLATLEEVFEAIRSLRVRGAPLIGITAAMGVSALARRKAREEPAADGSTLRRPVDDWCDRLEQARPTAVNLAWALRRMRRAAGEVEGTARDVADRLRREADDIRDEDRRMCRRIGEHAVELLKDGSKVVTHCNAGALATGGIGTALAPLYVARERGMAVHVFADETRPLLQGSRLTAWELSRAGVDVTVLADGMASALMERETPDVVFVGADRIAANGDVANKIGTYGLAVLARHHGVPFYVLAPTSTVDLSLDSGSEIPIEHRSSEEIRRGFGTLTAPEEVAVWSPAFDVTPADLVHGIVTEQGVARPPYGESLRRAVEAADAERASGQEGREEGTRRA